MQNSGEDYAFFTTRYYQQVTVIIVRHIGGVVANGVQPLGHPAHVYVHNKSRLHFPIPVSKWYDFRTDHGTIAQESARLPRNGDKCDVCVGDYSSTTLNAWRTNATALGISCWLQIFINTPQSRCVTFGRNFHSVTSLASPSESSISSKSIGKRTLT